MAISEAARAKFEQIGLQVCRNDIAMGFLFQNDEALHRQMVEWVIEQDKIEACRLLKERSSTLLWTKVSAGAALIAAVAAVIAAYPILFGK
jgi:hypothetical protein